LPIKVSPNVGPTTALTKCWTIVAYGAMITAALGFFALIRGYGEVRDTPVTTATSQLPTEISSAGHASILVHVLMALAAVLITGRVLGRACVYLRQPPVVGEVVAGILLGPSLLGWVSPEAGTYVLPATVTPFLGVIAQLGVILYMFLVGLDLNTDVLRQRMHATVAISHASIIVPFLSGAVLALGLYPQFAGSDVSFTSFALFLGISMSVTAFPVLARILRDRGMGKTELGMIALTCAAVDDVTAWCLLAFVVGVAQARLEGALQVTVLTISYLGLMVWFVRPLLRRLAARYPKDRSSQGVVGLVFVGLLLSSLATEKIGIHALFGAFLFGAVIPRENEQARTLARKLEEVVTVLLLPAFFALTGMRTQIGLVSGMEQWLVCGLIVVVATAGKFGGTFVPAWLIGLGGRKAAALGILMNTRGLMELIVLNIGLDLKILSPSLFAMLVLMALATTIATTPLLELIMAREKAVSKSVSLPRAAPLPKFAVQEPVATHV
jgi:Kef-type K+ transport system membrane component KefB